MGIFIAAIWILWLISLAVFLPVALLPVKVKIDEEEINKGSTICGRLFELGLISKEDYLFEKDIVAKQTDPITMIGYFYEVKPILFIMKHSRVIDGVVLWFVNNWISKQKAIYKGNTKPTLVGRIMDFQSKYKTKTLGLAILKIRTIVDYLYTNSLLFYSSSVMYVSLIFSALVLDTRYFASMLILSLLGFLHLEHMLKPNNTTIFNATVAKRALYSSAALSIVWFCVAMFISNDLNTINLLGLGVLVGFINGAIGFTVGHEFSHMKGISNKLISKAIFATVGYPNFWAVHTLGHHRDIGTKVDISTAKFDQSVYSFVSLQFKTFFTRVTEISKKEAIYDFGLIATILIGLSFISYKAVILYLIQSVIAFSLLEIINYVQHYGLIKKNNLNMELSWDCNNTISNGMMFNMGRHAHHHYSAGTPFYELEPANINSYDHGYISILSLSMFTNIFKEELKVSNESE